MKNKRNKGTTAIPHACIRPVYLAVLWLAVACILVPLSINTTSSQAASQGEVKDPLQTKNLSNPSGGGPDAKSSIVTAEIFYNSYPAASVPRSSGFDFPVGGYANHDGFDMCNCFGCNLDIPGYQGHTAEDFYNARSRDPVYTVSEGIVVYCGLSPGGWGNVIIVQHKVQGEMIYSQYAHLNDIFVVVGEVVVRRQQIGTVGETGTSEPHLHFEIKDQPALGHGYTGYGFSGVTTIAAWGINYYLPTWYIQNHRNLMPYSLVADASNPTGVFFIEGETKRGVPAEVYNSWGFARYPIEYISHDSFESYATTADLSKLVSVDGRVYFIDRGAKRWIPDPNIFNIWGFNWNAITPISVATKDYLHSETDLSFLAQMEGAGTVYLVDNKTKHPILSPDLLQNFGYPALRDVSVVSNDYPLSTGASIDSFTIKGSGTAKYVMSEGHKKLIPNDTVLNLWNLGSSNFTVLADSTIDNIYSGTDLSSLGQTYGQPGVYFLEGGAKRAIVNFDTFSNWGFDQNNIFRVSPGTTNAFPGGDDLTLLALNAGKVYMVQNNTFRHIFDADTFNIFRDNWGLGWGDIKPVSDSVLASKSPGVDITFPKLVTYSGGGVVYYMDSDGKRPIQNAPTFEHWGFNWDAIFHTNNNAFLAGYPSPNPLSVLASNSGMVYLISNGEKHPIDSAQSFNNHATFDPVYNWDNIFPVSNEALSALLPGATIY